MVLTVRHSLPPVNYFLHFSSFFFKLVISRWPTALCGPTNSLKVQKRNPDMSKKRRTFRAWQRLASVLRIATYCYNVAHLPFQSAPPQRGRLPWYSRLYTSSYLRLRQSRSTKALSSARPRPSMDIRMPCRLSCSVHSVEVNWQP